MRLLHGKWNKVIPKKLPSIPKDKISIKKLIVILALLVVSYFLGGGIAILVDAMDKNNVIVSEESNWGLGFSQPGMAPTGNATADELKKYDAYFIGDSNKKDIYLTFDAGYENGQTEKILDALKKYNAPATFFLVGNYLKTAPDLVKRMIEEGHTVANHTYNHPNMSKISNKDAFAAEMVAMEVAFEELTGKELTKFYRPPQGIYSTENLKMAQELGYDTFFWSLAYVDWLNDKQPSKEDAFKKLLGRVHPGAIVLLHSTSKTNGDIMDELLGKYQEMGYTFGKLEDLTQ